MAEQPAPDEPTYPCRMCGRRFIKSSLVKHEPACKKLTKMQRKIFDSGKQRAMGTEIPLAHIQKVKKEREKMGGFFPRPKTHWRERHEEFINAVSASKQVEHALKTGAPLPPPPKTSMNSVYRGLDPADCMTIYGCHGVSSLPSTSIVVIASETAQELDTSQDRWSKLKVLSRLKRRKDYVQCDFCGRSFNRHAAERHIPFCEEQSKRRGTAKPQTRSSSLSRAATSRRSSDQPPTTSSKRSSSRENSMTRDQARAVSRRDPSKERPPATRQDRQNANSATMAQRSQLPTPVKRSSSASKVPPTASGLKAPSTRNGHEKSPKTRGHDYDRPPKTGSTTSYGRAPKTSASTYERPPKTSASTYERAPKTASSGSSSTPKTPTPKSRGRTSAERRPPDTAASRRSTRSSSRKRN